MNFGSNLLRATSLFQYLVNQIDCELQANHICGDSGVLAICQACSAEYSLSRKNDRELLGRASVGATVAARVGALLWLSRPKTPIVMELTGLARTLNHCLSSCL